MKLPLFVAACGAMLMLAFRTHQPNVSLISKDTTINPQYQRFVRINTSVQEYLYFKRIKDSIVNAYRQEMGDKTLRMYFEAEDYLLTRTVLDSVIIKK
jgi:hypothetical protein